MQGQKDSSRFTSRPLTCPDTTSEGVDFSVEMLRTGRQLQHRTGNFVRFASRRGVIAKDVEAKLC